jgi:hypothetical protein
MDRKRIMGSKRFAWSLGKAAAALMITERLET